MSYFGISGPAQDGGFIAGIGAGAARLKNARAARAKHAKALSGMNRRLGSSLGNPGPQPVESVKSTTAGEFLKTHGVMLTSAAKDRLAAQDEAAIIPQYYVSFEDINLHQVQFLVNNEIKRITPQIKRDNPNQSEGNISIYATRQGRGNIRDIYMIPLFTQAGYDKNQANILAQTASSRSSKKSDLYTTARNAVEATVYKPGDEQAPVEYVVNQGLPKNTTQYALYGTGLALVAYLYLVRRGQRRAKTSKGALYGVFS